MYESTELHDHSAAHAVVMDSTGRCHDGAWPMDRSVLLLDASGQPLVETAGSVLNNGALCRLVDPLLQLIKSSVRLHRACGGLNV